MISRNRLLALVLGPLVLALLLVWADRHHAGASQAPDGPVELKILDRFAGTWDTAMLSKRAEWTPKEFRTTGTEKFEWVLGGRFIQSKGLSDPGNLQNLTMMTYDAAYKEYRFWYFDSQGNNGHFAGQWDAAANTFTSKADWANGITAINRVQFLDQDTWTWHLVAKDKGGKVYLDMEGKVTRKK